MDKSLLKPLDAIAFDCDGTLSSIEGIDELAEYNGVAAEVKQLTAEAMNRGINTYLYQQRLDKVRPTRAQVVQVGHEYALHVTAHAQEVIRLLQHAGKAVYILSAGLRPAVELFAGFLGVPVDHVFAVDVRFESPSGNYRSFDRDSPLTTSQGKATIVNQLKRDHPRIALVGDGMNDFLSAYAATYFIGFGGHYYRDTLAVRSPAFIRCADLLPVLLLCLTAEEQRAAVGELADALLLAKKYLAEGHIIVNQY